MAKFGYDVYTNAQTQSNENRSKVGYFKLANDGDEAIVRFVYSNASQFDLETVHKVQIGNQFRRVACLRGPLEPIDNCPLCKANIKTERKFYVKLVEYVPVKDNAGNIVGIQAVPKVWERPASGKNDFVKIIKAYLDEYGDLTQMVFKVKRFGVAGSLQTTYEVIPANQQMYPENVYVKDFSGFSDLDLAHHSFMSKNANELNEFLRTGKFPQTSGVENTQPMQVPNGYANAQPVQNVVNTNVQFGTTTPANNPATYATPVNNPATYAQPTPGYAQPASYVASQAQVQPNYNPYAQQAQGQAQCVAPVAQDIPMQSNQGMPINRVPAGAVSAQAPVADNANKPKRTQWEF